MVFSYGRMKYLIHQTNICVFFKYESPEIMSLTFINNKSLSCPTAGQRPLYTILTCAGRNPVHIYLPTLRNELLTQPGSHDDNGIRT